MLKNICFSTYTFCGFASLYLYMEFTDYCEGRYDTLGPYPRNPKKQTVDVGIQRLMTRYTDYDNIRHPLFEIDPMYGYPIAGGSRAESTMNISKRQYYPKTEEK